MEIKARFIGTTPNPQKLFPVKGRTYILILRNKFVQPTYTKDPLAEQLMLDVKRKRGKQEYPLNYGGTLVFLEDWTDIKHIKTK